MLQTYIDKLNNKFRFGIATEHTYRGSLENLIEAVLKGYNALNEPSRETFGSPDFILKNEKDATVGYIETKDLGEKDLSGLKPSGNKVQFDKYKKALQNIIFTDYLDFHLYREGIFVSNISIGKIQNGVIVPITENFAEFEHFLKTFSIHKPQTIKSSKRLAELMAGKARLLSNVIEKALNTDYTHEEDSALKNQLNSFKAVLMQDITAEDFADIYAQTITYGMFAARLHDPTLATFSRQEAAGLIPKSNPFLRKLFGYIVGIDIDERLVWIVDDLVQIFLACDVADILKNYKKSAGGEDPIIHFYEDFLSEYDPVLRKARGVWYTPKPVVNFIVRAVDDILKKDFNISQGLADTTRMIPNGKLFKKNEMFKVQILDPATGTGTFLAEVIRHIHRNFKGQQGVWNEYVEKYLIPRLNGFEILMASYAMAHLQLDLLLSETGFKSNRNQRLNVFLTNSLDEYHKTSYVMFEDLLSVEADEANRVKRESPVMCVIGNPPYSGESENKGKWIMNLMEDYKKEPEGKEKLKERNPKWINDDYVKFLRYGQHFIEKTGEGIVAFINPHGFLDNPTFRGMRWNLLKTYDKIYVIDLHGNSTKKEVSPDGSADVNVFDIMQGVSINIFVKTGTKKPKELGKVFHFDLFGKREMKYDFLDKNSLNGIKFKELPNVAPNYFFVGKDFEEQKGYEKGFSMNELFLVNSVGIVTARDEFTIHNTLENVKITINEFLNLDDEQARKRFKLGSDARDWQVNYARKDLKSALPENSKFTKISYRPFDDKWTFYTGKSKGFHCYPRNEVMKHFLDGRNLGLIIGRQGQVVGSMSWNLAFISKSITDFNMYYRGGGVLFPLYLEPPKQFIIGQKPEERTPNLNSEIVNKIATKLGLRFTNEKDKTIGNFAPIDVLDYIYAILHSPNYREKYKEFLKIDFPKVPYPKNLKSFLALVKLGREIRQIHLLESPIVDKYITQYPKSGNNTVLKPNYVPSESKIGTGSVYINETQFFANVPNIAWNFYIGGYQPAQKWLKDRKERILSFEDIQHYQKIIVALSETAKLMQEIDLVGVE